MKQEHQLENILITQVARHEVKTADGRRIAKAVLASFCTTRKTLTRAQRPKGGRKGLPRAD